MDRKEIESIKIAIKFKPSEKLLDIWKANDRESWHDEAFVAIQETLTLRSIELPLQTKCLKPINRKPKRSETQKREIITGFACVISGGFMAFSSSLPTDWVIMPYGLILSGILTLAKHGILEKQNDPTKDFQQTKH